MSIHLDRIKKPFLIAVLWLLFIVIDIIKKPALDYSSDFFLWFYLFGFLIWISLTLPAYGVFVWSQKFGTWKRITFLALLGPAIGGLKVTLSRFFYYVMGNYLVDSPSRFENTQIQEKLVFFYAEATIIAWVLLIIFYVIELSLKYRDQKLKAIRLESDLAQANLQALKMQIQPHFLFNTHNAIATLMRSDQNEQALKMLLGLSDLLRLSLTNFENQLVPFSEEMFFIKKYLAIERVRFEDRLKVEYDIDNNDLKALVPVFILQPLVENAIKHGVSKNLGESFMEISASQRGTDFIIRVFNTGNLGENGIKEGIGLDNVKNRIRNLYGMQAELALKTVDSGVQATLQLPYQNESNEH